MKGLEDARRSPEKRKKKPRRTEDVDGEPSALSRLPRKPSTLVKELVAHKIQKENLPRVLDRVTEAEVVLRVPGASPRRESTASEPLVVTRAPLPCDAQLSLGAGMRPFCSTQGPCSDHG